MSKFLLVLGENQLSDEEIESIKAQLPVGMSFVQCDDVETAVQYADEIEICAGWCGPKYLQHFPNLKWAQVWAAGANWILKHPELQKRPFVLTNGSGIHAVNITEHIFAFILQHARGLRLLHEAQKAHHWVNIVHPSEPYPDERFPFSSGNLTELPGKTILLLGVGAIGERTAKIAKAFDMHVIGLRNNPQKGSPFVDEMVGSQQLLEVIPRADFIVSSLPSTPETHHFLNKEAIDLMKTTAFVVNVGRGDNIEEEALLDALRRNAIAGAALDVVEQEPLPGDAPHWDMPNLTITSHYSGSSPHYHQRALVILLDNLERYKNNEPLRNVVDKQAGY
ncbi:MAG: D-2-hydroxyacid dehydrogenase [Chloroflexota bacterium]